MANSDKNIVYTQNDFLVVMSLSDKCGLTVEEIQAKDVPDGVTSYIVDHSSLPTDTDFQNAWVYKDGSVQVDLTKAKEVHKEYIRRERTEKLAALDIEFQRALETSADTSAIVAKKQALRDATADSAINAATSTDQLRAQWNTSILGKSPYTS
tara:strand:- start:274 stop:732 length:459 start_codon:yes stop_codon:yes gene_type:complete